MTLKIGVIMDPIASINYKKDSTLAMLWAAQDKGWQLHYMEQQDLFIENGIAYAHYRLLSVFKNPDKWFEMGSEQTLPLGDFDIILMRKDPPFDMEFVYSTYMLEAAERAGTLVVNKPQSLRDCNEKVFATEFPECCTPTLVSAKADKIKQFAAQHQDVILKPLDGMGGASIFRTGDDDPNLNVIIETVSAHGQTPIMAQRFIPEIKSGDKRIIVVNGEPMPYCLARIPMAGENRGNLAVGGSGVVQPITDRDRWICEQVRPTLLKKGLIFVGLDVIGDYLTEINVTSPTCIREIDAGSDTNIAAELMDVLEKKMLEQNR
ncbi:MAG: glutathione synthase [Gammaproteobacteria bacterium]|nr:MAG: glutathione synthase [Gammaproteobacteria bacterium]